MIDYRANDDKRIKFKRTTDLSKIQWEKGVHVIDQNAQYGCMLNLGTYGDYPLVTLSNYCDLYDTPTANRSISGIKWSPSSKFLHMTYEFLKSSFKDQKDSEIIDYLNNCMPEGMKLPRNYVEYLTHHKPVSHEPSEKPFVLVEKNSNILPKNKIVL